MDRCIKRDLLRSFDPVCFHQQGEKMAPLYKIPYFVGIDTIRHYCNLYSGFDSESAGRFDRCVSSRNGDLSVGHSYRSSVQPKNPGRTA